MTSPTPSNGKSTISVAMAYSLSSIGKKVLEVRPKDAHKGTAISNFMQDGPFLGKIPIFIGDDTSDEDGF